MNPVVELTLSTDEAKLVSELLIGDKTRLVEEINHTDRREFREFLKQREEMLENVLTKMHS
jgi:hypothetical protein